MAKDIFRLFVKQPRSNRHTHPYIHWLKRRTHITLTDKLHMFLSMDCRIMVMALLSLAMFYGHPMNFIVYFSSKSPSALLCVHCLRRSVFLGMSAIFFGSDGCAVHMIASILIEQVFSITIVSAYLLFRLQSLAIRILRHQREHSTVQVGDHSFERSSPWNFHGNFAPRPLFCAAVLHSVHQLLSFPQRFQVLFIVRRHRDFYAFKNWYRHKNFKWLLSKIHCNPSSAMILAVCVCVSVCELLSHHSDNGHITILLCCRPESFVFSSGSIYCPPPRALSWNCIAVIALLVRPIRPSETIAEGVEVVVVACFK